MTDELWINLLAQAPTVAVLLFVWWRLEQRNSTTESFVRDQLDACYDRLASCLGLDDEKQKTHKNLPKS